MIQLSEILHLENDSEIDKKKLRDAVHKTIYQNL